MVIRRLFSYTLGVLVCGAYLSTFAYAGSFAAPGDSLLRHDLQLLDDAGLVNIPLTAWPVSLHDVASALDTVEISELDEQHLLALTRVRARAEKGTNATRFDSSVKISGAITPPVIRTFENTPREEGEIAVRAGWDSGQFAANLQVSVTANPDDNDRFRLDGSYLGTQWGNWFLSAGWQERWWGPGNGGSLILSSNARPVPAISIQRAQSSPFRSRWLRWIGPWTFAGFVGQLDDERVVNDALLMGMRLTFRPTPSIEIGVSRTAQLCGDGRVCNASTIGNTLIGRDNRGVNVSAEDEPGNQLAGFDLRWRLPGPLQLATYVQWIAEDTRRGGPELGNWLRMAGVEHWGQVGVMQHRSYIEIAETSCREGGLGFSDLRPNCAYENGLYRTGYRYRGRPLGYGTDGDGLSYSAGTTLVQSAGHRWAALMRYAEINRIGFDSDRHSLSSSPAKRSDLLLTHQRQTANGLVNFGIGWTYQRVAATSKSNSDPVVFVEWQSGKRD